MQAETQNSKTGATPLQFHKNIIDKCVEMYKSVQAAMRSQIENQIQRRGISERFLDSKRTLQLSGFKRVCVCVCGGAFTSD